MSSDETSEKGGNGHPPELAVPVTYPHILDVPPGSTALVVPIDGLRQFVQALSREWMGLNAEFFDRLVQHVATLDAE